MAMKNVVLLSSRTFSHVKILQCLRNCSRSYASDGVMYWVSDFRLTFICLIFFINN